VNDGPSNRSRVAISPTVLRRSLVIWRVGLPRANTAATAQKSGSGLRYARTAMNASRLDRSSLTVFDRDALAVTVVGAPDLMVRISDNVLGALDDLPEPVSSWRCTAVRE
jgi:hypothetical protein